MRQLRPGALAECHRIGWPNHTGFAGRMWPDSLVGIDRIKHSGTVKIQVENNDAGETQTASPVPTPDAADNNNINDVSISVTKGEDEHTDQDVTNQVHIDTNNSVDTAGDKNATILIYHTHTREAYTPDFSGQYAEANGFHRTDNKNFSVCNIKRC